MTEILYGTRSLRAVIRPVNTGPSAAVLEVAKKAAAIRGVAGLAPAYQLLTLELERLKAAESASEIVLENLEGNNGLEMQFSVRRGIDMLTSSGMLKIFNLPEEMRSRIAGEVRTIGRIEDVDLGGPVWPIGMLDDIGSQATPAALGYATVEIQAGYDGSLSTIFAGTLMDCQVVDDRVTSETTLYASSGIAQVALSSAGQTFAAGTATFAVLDTLRRVLKLGPGNCTQETWLNFISQAALHTNKNGAALFSASSVLAAPYIVTDAADQQLEQFLAYSGVRHFIDEGELWLVPRVGFIPGAPAKLGRLKERPRRTPSGQLDCKAFFSGDVRPGRLVYVDATGVDPALTGTYRCDNLSHDGGTNASEEYSTQVLVSQRQVQA